LAQALTQHRTFIVGEVLADRFEMGTVSESDVAHEFAFEGETLRLRLTLAVDPIG